MTTAQPSPGVLGVAGLLERETELVEAARLLEDVRAGRGGLLLIEGAAGLGKSTLLDESRTLAGGFLVLEAVGREVERDLGWGVARSLFEPWLVRLGEDERADLFAGPAASASLLLGPGGEASLLPTAEVSFGILHGLYWLAARAAESQPTLLIVDDAHWSDEPSLRLLLYLLGRIRDRPIGLVVAARSGERGAGGLLAQLAAERGVRVCELAPLSAAAVTGLIKSQLPEADDGFCRRCWELTAGNPLGVRELLLAIPAGKDSAGPELNAIAERAARSLARSVLRRLGSLSADARVLADAVSVFEVRVELQWAAALAGLDSSAALGAADELARADILTAEDPVSFTHPLLCATVYGALPRGRRVQAHRRAAALLIEAHAPAEQVAAHLLESSPAGDGEVVAVLRDAARGAMTHGVPVSAARYLERALREPPAAADRGQVMIDLGRAEALAGLTGAPARLEAAISGSRDSSERAGLLLDLARALAQARRMEESTTACVRGLDELGANGSELALELEATYLTSAMHLPELASEVRRRVGGILTDDAALTTRARRGLVSKAMIVRLFAADPYQETLVLARRIFAGGRLVDEDRFDSQVLTHVVSTLGWCDDYASADEAIGMTLAAAARSGSALAFAMASQLRARQRLWTGPADGALADARAATEWLSGGGLMYRNSASYCLVWALLERNALDEATSVLEGIESTRSPTGRSAWLEAARGLLAVRIGDDETALEAFLACGRRLDALLVQNPVVLPWRSDAGLAAYRLGREEQAHALIAEELRLTERFGAPRALAVARRAAGLLDRDDGVRLLRSAAGALQTCGAELERGRTLVALGGAIRRSGQPREAREVLREALALANANASDVVADDARAELRLAGGRAPNSASNRDRADELTPSERRVAELAAQGRTNREIANELFVTVKAVEWHLGNSYRKLNIRGRRALGPALAKN